MLKLAKQLGAYGAVFCGAFCATALALLVGACWLLYRTGIVPCVLAVLFIGVFSWLLNKMAR
jgi:hypothetical protein